MGFSLYETILWHIDHKDMEPGEIIDELLQDGYFNTVCRLRNVRYFDFAYDLEVIRKLIELNNLEQAKIYIKKFKPRKADTGYIRDCIEEHFDTCTSICTRSKSSSLEFIKSYYNII